MTRKYVVIGVLLIAAILLATAICYPDLPSRIPRHWDIHGRINGYWPKWTLFVADPLIMILTLAIFAVLPWLSPKQFEVDSFRTTSMQIMLIILVIIAYVHVLILCAALSANLSVNRALMGGICLGFALLGNLIGKVRRNFYLGIRTPWTLANERVWNATHRFAAKTFFVSGLVGLLGAVVRAPFIFSLVAIGVGTLAPVLYSLVFYKQLEARGEL